MMDKIYRSAKRVLAWLGPGGGNDEAGLQILERLSQLPKPRHIDDPMGLEASECLLIKRFLDLPLFRRFWTVQECVLNTDVTLTCGESEITFPRLLAGLKMFDIHFRFFVVPQGFPGLCAIRKTADLWNKYSFAESIQGGGQMARRWAIRESETAKDETSMVEPFDILALVHEFTENNCSDDRDRIFTLYALASNIKPKSENSYMEDDMVYMDVDYTLDVYDTYKAFPVACLENKVTLSPCSVENRMALKLFKAALTRLPNTGTREWPFWVPDWRMEPHNSVCFVVQAFVDVMICVYAISGDCLEIRPKPYNKDFLGMDCTSIEDVNGSGDHLPSIVKVGVVDPGYPISQLLKSAEAIWEPRTTSEDDQIRDDDEFLSFFLAAMAQLHSRLPGTGVYTKREFQFALDYLYEGNVFSNKIENEEFMDGEKWKGMFPFRVSQSVLGDDGSNELQGFGYGSGQVQEGDRLIVLRYRVFISPGFVFCTRIHDVLILQKVGNINGSDTRPSYRLVGHGFFCGPEDVDFPTGLRFLLV
ncbi:HET domain containing protein [Pyrenophora tritici-repentis]|nr:HET domain containing protein [Pyrenophora tritici-repentis]